jgi:hypothetical protein
MTLLFVSFVALSSGGRGHSRMPQPAFYHAARPVGQAQHGHRPHPASRTFTRRSASTSTITGKPA